jgi:hypothetical protein
LLISRMAHSQTNGRYGRFADIQVEAGVPIRSAGQPPTTPNRRTDGTIVALTRGAETYHDDDNN